MGHAGRPQDCGWRKGVFPQHPLKTCPKLTCHPSSSPHVQSLWCTWQGKGDSSKQFPTATPIQWFILLSPSPSLPCLIYPSECLCPTKLPIRHLVLFLYFPALSTVSSAFQALHKHCCTNLRRQPLVQSGLRARCTAQRHSPSEGAR